MAEDEHGHVIDWIREPPGAAEIRLLVETGEGVDLSPEAQQALERLVNELSDAEVSGYAMGSLNIGLFGSSPMTVNSSCQKQTCSKHECSRHDCSGTYTSALY